MRTPGEDIDLALGFLLTEGVIRSAEDVRTAQLCAGDGAANTYNVVDVALGPDVPPPQTDPARNFLTSSSCGVCGKASIDAIRTRSRYDVAADPATVAASVLVGLPETLRAAQPELEHRVPLRRLADARRLGGGPPDPNIADRRLRRTGARHRGEEGVGDRLVPFGDRRAGTIVAHRGPPVGVVAPHP